jgi:uncharacterized membrane protein
MSGSSPERTREAAGSWRLAFSAAGESVGMGIGVSIVLVALGAILIWGVTAEVAGIDVNAIGWILLIVGIIGAIISMIFWSSWGGGGRRERETVVRDEPPRY